MPKRGDENVRRLRAFNDYAMLPIGERSVQRLLDLYQEQERETPGSVPTTQRTTLYRWSQEDAWNEKLAEEEEEVGNERKLRLEQIRKEQYSTMISLLLIANEALAELIEQKDDKRVRLRAALELLNRTGFPAESKIGAANRRNEQSAEDNAPIAPPPQRPAEGASEAEWARYAAEKDALRLVK